MRHLLIGALIACFGISIAPAQTNTNQGWDYEAYPNLPFDVEHLTLNLTVAPGQGLIRGIARYNLSSKREGVSRIIFHTADVAIQGVMQGGEEIDYLVSGDSLIINLPDTLNRGEASQFHITWQSQSYYGIHSDVYGNMWTSQNPGAHHHWFPVFDHPRVSAAVDVYITLPARYTAVFNGELMEDEVISTDEKKLHWQSETPLPVTGLGLAVGDFIMQEAVSGVKKVRLFAGRNLLLEEVKAGLLQIAVSTLKKLESELSFEYPYEALSIVVLPDSWWQEKQSGSGVVYLYQNLGSLSNQLKRGIAAQWFGQYQRSTSFTKEVGEFEFLKTALLGAAPGGELKNPDSLRSIEKWNYWQQAYPAMKDSSFRETAEESLPELVRAYSGVVEEGDYAKFWYDRSGTYRPELPGIDIESGTPDSVKKYAVNYLYDELSTDLQLVFQAEREGVESLIGVELTEFGFSDTTLHELSFTGETDTVSVDLSSGVEYVTLQITGERNISLRQNKPFYFLLSQLRSSDPELRAEAASGLAVYANNPDLQLALMDILNMEGESKVKAVVLQTLAEVTRGAAGTEQVFLDALSAESAEVKLSAIKALGNYKGSENVSYSVRSQLTQTDSDSVFKYALQTYQKVAENQALISLAERFQRSDSTGSKALKVLEAAAPADTSSRSFEIAGQYLAGSHPYPVRAKALLILVNYQDSPDFWLPRIENLVSDPDPRIRYLGLDVLQHLETERAEEILGARAKEEFDPRVLNKIYSLQNQ